MDRSVLWRAAALQALFVAVLAVILAVSLPKSFFREWGFLAGPGAWLACALLVGRVLRLPWTVVVVGATLSGIPSILALAVGVHWAGAPLGVLVFGAWCARAEVRGRGLTAEVV